MIIFQSITTFWLLLLLLKSKSEYPRPFDITTFMTEYTIHLNRRSTLFNKNAIQMLFQMLFYLLEDLLSFIYTQKNKLFQLPQHKKLLERDYHI